MPPTSRSRPARLLLGVVTSLVLLSACSGSEEPAAPQAEGGSSAPAPTATPEPEAPALPGVVPVLPDGTLQVTARVEAKPTEAGYDVGEASVLHDEERIYLVTPTDTVVAIDRASGAEVWRTDLTFEDGHACRSTALPPGASAMAVFGGDLCHSERVLDLETGALQGTQQLSASTQPVQVGSWSYVVSIDGVVSRIEADGSLQPVGTVPGVVAFEREIGETLGSPDSDLLVVELKPALIRQEERRTRLLGFRLSADGTSLEPAFDVLRRKALGDVVAGSTLTGYGASRGLEDLLFSRLTPSGSRYRLARLDPATGQATRRVELTLDGPGGNAALLGFSSDQAALVQGDQVFATTLDTPDALADSITRYDLDDTGGRVTWTWTAPRSKKALFHSSAAPIAASDDGTRLYVSVTDSRDPTLLVELDAATGTETRRWSVPTEATPSLVPQLVVVDDQVVAYRADYATTDRKPYFASLLTIG